MENGGCGRRRCHLQLQQDLKVDLVRLKRVRMLGEPEVLKPRAHLVGVGVARLDVLVLAVWRVLRVGAEAVANLRREKGHGDGLLGELARSVLGHVLHRQLLQPLHTQTVDVERPDVRV